MKLVFKPEEYGVRPLRINKQRLKKALYHLHQALAEYYRKEMGRGSGLPTDWRDRIICYSL